MIITIEKLQIYTYSSIDSQKRLNKTILVILHLNICYKIFRCTKTNDEILPSCKRISIKNTIVFIMNFLNFTKKFPFFLFFKERMVFTFVRYYSM